MINKKLTTVHQLFFATAIKTQDLNPLVKVTPSVHGFCAQAVANLKEARGSFFGLRVEVLKLQSRIQDTLRSPSYYIIISTYDQS